MKVSKKKLILILALIFIAFIATFSYLKYDSYNTKQKQKTEQINCNEISQKEKNPNECVFVGCGNFF